MQKSNSSFWAMLNGSPADQVIKAHWGAKHVVPIDEASHNRSGLQVFMVSKDGKKWYWAHGSGTSCVVSDGGHDCYFVARNGLEAFYQHELMLAESNAEQLKRKVAENNERIKQLLRLIQDSK